MLGGEGTKKEYSEKYSIRFRRGAKEVAPTFNVKRYFPEVSELPDVNKISGIFKGVIFNDKKDIPKKDGKTATIPANFVAVVEDKGDVVYYVEVSCDSGTQLRPFLNSLLSVNVWDSIEFFTKFSKGKDGNFYKVINVTNPDKKKEITYTDKKTGEKKKMTVNEEYSWAVAYKDIPEVTVLKDGDEVIKVKDEEANDFFKQKILEKFSSEKAESGGEIATEENLPF